MNSPLHILHLEDNSNDAALVQSILKDGGIATTTKRVQTEDDFVAALDEGGIDLIISDYSLPQFDGLSALKIAHARLPDLPVIMVSGTLGEELAIESLKNGATDYLLKERLSRLVPAVRRAMQEVKERTDRRRLEAQFTEAQKMEGVGQLAAGVAHDFNNVLSVIRGYTDLIACDAGPDSPLLKYTEEIGHATDRAAGLTQQLLVFSHKQIVEPVVLDLNEVIKGIEKMLRRLVDEKIEVTITPKKEPGHIKADSGYLGQVLMNLVVNARDAMPNGGKLGITTSNVVLDEAYVRAHPKSIAGSYVLLSVSDTGTGMTDEVKESLFKPFFTTKPLGKGTGLGLATCHVIVQHSGGYIDVVSELGVGTTFQIYFPQVDQPLEIASIPILAGPLPRGTETVLIVEDEPALRQLARGILKIQGYHVLAASNGREALQMVHTHVGSPITLVFTDIIMPLMNGKVMAGALRMTYPKLKILFTSGYTDELVGRHRVAEEGIDFIPKPYTQATLVWKVREMLDAGVPENCQMI